MSTHRIIKYGEKRVVTKTLRKGEAYYGQGGKVYIDEDCLVDVVEEFQNSGSWELYERKWDTIRPIPAPPPKPPGFWARLFGRGGLPKATLVGPNYRKG